MSIIYISKSKWQRNIVQRCATKCCIIIQNKPSKQKFKFLQDVEGLNCTSLVQGDKPLLVARIAGRMYVDGFLLFDPFLISCTVQTTKEGTGESLEVTLVIGGLSSRHFGQQHCYTVHLVHLVHLVHQLIFFNQVGPHDHHYSRLWPQSNNFAGSVFKQIFPSIL